MKQLIFLLCLILNLQVFAADTVIISDFDDTIKRSNIPNIWPNGAANSILWRKVYTGMPEFFEEIESEINGLYVLSASPSALKPFIVSLLCSYEINYVEVFTRNFLATEEKIAYKLERIEQVLETHSNDKLIMMGDDVEADHDVYLQIAEKHPARVDEIYIHNVVNSEVPESIISYFTPLDIAVNEYKKERLNASQVERIANTILDTRPSKMYRVIPKYSHCPISRSEFKYSIPTEITDIVTKVQTKIISYCLTRKMD